MASPGWLRATFDLSPSADRLCARTQPASVTSLLGQARFFRRRFPGFTLVVQRGNQPHVLVLERGYLKTGFKRRVFQSLWWPTPAAVNASVGAPPSAMPLLAIPLERWTGLSFAPFSPGTDHVC